MFSAPGSKKRELVGRCALTYHEGLSESSGSSRLPVTMDRASRNAGLLMSTSLWLILAGCGSRATSTPESNTVGSDDPRLTFVTPYRNVRPEVKYVGDDICAQCHVVESEAFHHHPMGRSLAPMAAWAARERYDAAARNPFTAAGFDFLVERRGDKVFHKESRRDVQGQVISEMDAEIQYVVGSGEHGHSYLIEREGYLFQSPLTWYTQKQAWDLAPGFTADMHADRQVQAGCVFCHCNQAEPVPNTLNRYRTPVFRGY